MATPTAGVRSAPLRHRAHCECGWSGKRRFMRGSAVLDVLDHCNDTGHLPYSPLPVVADEPYAEPDGSAYDPDAWGMGNPER
jgi:hypothetical protein